MPAASAAAQIVRLRPTMSAIASLLYQTARRTALSTALRQSATCWLCVQRLQTTTTHLLLRRRRRPTTTTAGRRWRSTSSPSVRCSPPCWCWPPSTPTSTSGHSVAGACSWRRRHPSSEHTVNDDELDVVGRRRRLEPKTGTSCPTDDLG